jgi:hypothetical protein
MGAEENRREARRLMETVDDARANALLVGAVDLHVHSGPSVMARQVDHLQAAEQAAAAGLKGILFKDHHYSVAPLLPMMERVLNGTGIAMYGGVVLNNTVGGLNPYAVDFNLKSGARLVWMPTAHAQAHIRSTHRRKRLASNIQLKEPIAISVVDDRGHLLDVCKEILDSIAEFDAILSSGHLHIAEIWVLFEEAKRRGVRRLLVNHPMYGLSATHDDITELAAMGAMIEQSACLYVDSRFNSFSPGELKEHIDAAGVAASSIASDLGQVDNPTPVEGMRQAVRLCLALGYSDDEVRTMVSRNPAKLVGLKGI